MRLLFCANPLDARQPDTDYAGELAAAQALGARTDLISYEALVNDGDADRAVRRVASADDLAAQELAVYRGWMLRPADYARLYTALLARGVKLINDPAAYRLTHYLPEAYPLIAAHTPRTGWLPLAPQTPPAALPLDAIMAALRPFGGAPVIVKDYVKSRKHEWAAATYIPSASDRAAVAQVVGRFVAGQGPDLNEGLIFRAFEQYAPLGTQIRSGHSGMPLIQEYRVFWLDGAPLATVPHWDADVADTTDAADAARNGVDVSAPPVAQFQPVAQRIQSRFFTMDIAPLKQPPGSPDQLYDSRWRIVELGDGQVAGLPARLDVAAFYAALIAALR
ncbi:MAG TPA: ATP-grasp domain-containing protein [Ktedonobacterales bacterium]|nr:ATP-grasp domain-containing protein [Ktedonobacterales bacterium]